jgi:hypothetical protein
MDVDKTPNVLAQEQSTEKEHSPVGIPAWPTPLLEFAEHHGRRFPVSNLLTSTDDAQVPPWNPSVTFASAPLPMFQPGSYPPTQFNWLPLHQQHIGYPEFSFVPSTQPSVQQPLVTMPSFPSTVGYLPPSLSYPRSLSDPSTNALPFRVMFSPHQYAQIAQQTAQHLHPLPGLSPLVLLQGLPDSLPTALTHPQSNSKPPPSKQMRRNSSPERQTTSLEDLHLRFVDPSYLASGADSDIITADSLMTPPLNMDSSAKEDGAEESFGDVTQDEPPRRRKRNRPPDHSNDESSLSRSPTLRPVGPGNHQSLPAPGEGEGTANAVRQKLLSASKNS